MSDGPLSLPARMHVLAWDTTRLTVTGEAQLPYLVRAAALTELVQRGLLTDDDGIAVPAGPDARTGDPVLDGLLELTEESRPRPWRTWITLRAAVTLDAVRARLAADGLLRVERTRVLKIFPSVEYRPAAAAVARRLHAEVRDILDGPVPADRVPPADAALIALAAAARLRTLPGAGERDCHRARIAALADRAGASAPVLHTLLHEVRSALLVPATAAPTAT